MTECAACDRPTDAVLCHRCTRRLGHILTELPAWLAELTVTVTRQAKTGAGDGGKTPKAFEQPLPYSPKAAELLDQAARGLRQWVTYFADPSDPITLDYRADSSAVWLLGHLGDIRLYERADELLTAMTALRDQIRRRVDNPAKRWVGRCTARVLAAGVSVDGHGVIVPTIHERQCGADLRTRTGDKTIRCRECGQEYDPVERMQWIVDQNAEHQASAPELAATFTSAGMPLKPATIRKWTQRGKLRQVRTVSVVRNRWEITVVRDDLGRPLYRVGDVRELVNAGRSPGLPRGMAAVSDRTADGDPINTYTMWLRFPDGEAALSVDTTAFDAAMSRAAASVDTIVARRTADPCGGNTKGGDGCSCDPPFNVSRVVLDTEH